MKPPRRIQLRRTKGWRIPANTKKVDRSTPFGNPFRITTLLLDVCKGDKVAAQAACVRSFRDWLIDSSEGRELRVRIRCELRGKNIGCWCPLSACMNNHPSSEFVDPNIVRKYCDKCGLELLPMPCHGSVILEIANASDPITVSTTRFPNGMTVTRLESASYKKAVRKIFDRVPDQFKNFGDPIT